MGRVRFGTSRGRSETRAFGTSVEQAGLERCPLGRGGLCLNRAFTRQTSGEESAKAAKDLLAPAGDGDVDLMTRGHCGLGSRRDFAIGAEVPAEIVKRLTGPAVRYRIQLNQQRDQG